MFRMIIVIVQLPSRILCAKEHSEYRVTRDLINVCRKAKMSLADHLVISRPLYMQDKCGYCHNTKTVEEATSIKSWIPYNKSFHKSNTVGFQVENMTIEQYEKLVNLNYRRSGQFLYKGDNLRNCCFFHTIRTSMEAFKISKELKNDLNKFNEYIGVGKNKAKHFDLDHELNKLFQSEKFKLKFEKRDENFDKKYKLFKSYQRSIHDDKTSERSFKSFLIDNPFDKKDAIIEVQTNPKTGEINYDIIEFGSIQLCYYYEDLLIGVSFLDILPSGISSIYFIYDHDLMSKEKLSMGKVTIMIELLMTKKLNLQYLYLGYYIRDCAKMKYKSKFGGWVLHPLTFEWVEFTDSKFKEFDDEIEQKYGYDNFDITDELIESLYQENLDFDTDREFFNIEKTQDYPYEVPLVVIESTPIETVLTMKNDIKLKALIGDDIIEIALVELSDPFKKMALNLIRLLGLELFDDVILYG